MSNLTNILNSVDDGDAGAAEELFSSVYRELRTLAAHKMRSENSGHTLQATALVHEAWLRLVGGEKGAGAWQNRGHFFAAAAEAMRRILVEHARRKQSQKRGSGAAKVELRETSLVLQAPPEELLAVNEALEVLAQKDPKTAELVKLRYFAGMTMDEAAAAMGIGKRSAEEIWTYARVWLHREIRKAR